MTSFNRGLLTGLISAGVTAAAAAVTYRLALIRPTQKAEAVTGAVERAAVRKSVSAHQSRY